LPNLLLDASRILLKPWGMPRKFQSVNGAAWGDNAKAPSGTATTTIAATTERVIDRFIGPSLVDVEMYYQSPLIRFAASLPAAIAPSLRVHFSNRTELDEL
jgi:hypothetical protein